MLRITGGKVYDPANNINGVVKDIFIDDSHIAAPPSSPPSQGGAGGVGGRTIDASGMIVFPGGVDIHTHVAGAALNFARAMTPESQLLAQLCTDSGGGDETAGVAAGEEWHGGGCLKSLS